jgi:hypothetical protein
LDNVLGMSAYPLITDMMGAIENGRDVPNHPLVRPSETAICHQFQHSFKVFSPVFQDVSVISFDCSVVGPQLAGTPGSQQCRALGQFERRGGCRALRHIVWDFAFRRDRDRPGWR